MLQTKQAKAIVNLLLKDTVFRKSNIRVANSRGTGRFIIVIETELQVFVPETEESPIKAFKKALSKEAHLMSKAFEVLSGELDDTQREEDYE